MVLTAGFTATVQAANELPANITVFVFDDVLPASGVEIAVEGGVSGRTDSRGEYEFTIGPGRHALNIKRSDEVITKMDLLTVAGETVQLIVTLRGDGKKPHIDIESSGGGKIAGGQGEKTEQKPGLLKGNVLSTENKTPVSGARVFVSGSDAEAVTDDKGEFSIELPPGNYALSIVHSEYSTQTLDNIRVIKEQVVTTEIDLSPTGLQLAEYVVTAPYIEGSIASVVATQREHEAVTEVIGAEQMSRSGASDAADALSKVTGLTLDRNGYVIIRGQPSRYTATLLNGSPLPSPDPIRRIVPLDLFPTDVLASIQVQKAYSADKPGSFGAGLIEMKTKQIPEKPFASLALKTGVNTQSFAEKGLTYTGGEIDYLGDDDGTRDVPGPVVEATDGGRTSLDRLTREERNELGKTFLNISRTGKKTLPPDVGLSASGGTRFEFENKTKLAILSSLSWSREYRNVDFVDREFNLGGDELIIQDDLKKQRTDMDVDLSGLLVLGTEWKTHQLISNSFFIRKTTQRTEFAEGSETLSDDRFVRNYLLEWNQRELFVQQFLGTHGFERFTVDWRLLTATGERDSPDRRTYKYVQLPDGSFRFFSETGLQRRYNTVDDELNGLGLDITVPTLKTKTLEWVNKLGLALSDKQRQSRIQRYTFNPDGADTSFDNPELIFTADNLDNGTVQFRDDTQTNEQYDGRADVQGQFISADIKWNEQWRFVAGIRRESADFEVITGVGTENEELGGFDDTRTLPAFSATWIMTEKTQVRVGFSRTVSYPMLVELSETRFFDPESGDQFLGNPELQPTLIDSMDFRWEWYPITKESITLGVFQKKYTDPIERSFVSLAGGGLLKTLQNADSAEVLGIEAGLRLGLQNLHGLLKNTYLSGNVALLDSKVTLTGEGVATSTKRPLQGQADQLFNLEAGYDGETHDATLILNFVGDRLDKAGALGVPDTYQQSLTTLDITYAYMWSDLLVFKFKASNVLNPDIKFIQGDELQRSFKKGISLGMSAKFNF